MGIGDWVPLSMATIWHHREKTEASPCITKKTLSKGNVFLFVRYKKSECEVT